MPSNLPPAEASHPIYLRDPAGVAESVRLVILALVALGVAQMDEAAAQVIAVGVAAAISLVATVWQRRHQWAEATVEDMGALSPLEDDSSGEVAL